MIQLTVTGDPGEAGRIREAVRCRAAGEREQLFELAPADSLDMAENRAGVKIDKHGNRDAM